ncbi:MAG: hypothetical protein ACO3M5_04870 [Saprospiraceae bacterium]|jgi:hypothetical protein
MKCLLLSFLFLLIVSCKEDKSTSVDPVIPNDPVTEDEMYITQEYIDSLKLNRQQRLIDLRRDLAFECVDIMEGKFIRFKIKVYPDGTFDETQVLEDTDIEVNFDVVRKCVNDYFAKNKKLKLGELKDLPSSGKNTNKHPHVYTLLIY